MQEHIEQVRFKVNLHGQHSQEQLLTAGPPSCQRNSLSSLLAKPSIAYPE